MEYRIEHDALGEKKIPSGAYWGIHTLRALENFPVSGRKVPVSLLHALAQVKKSCAKANAELGYFPEELSLVIQKACDDVIEGRLDQEFPLDMLQGGAGTSTNMNMNEVIANRALELMGVGRGEYSRVHPLEHVNRHQSTNDVYPTAVKVAAITLLRQLSTIVTELQGALQRKEQEFASIVKIGRTEMQEAVPITLGAEFSAWAEAVSRDRWRIFKCEERLRVVNLGGTAVGTGLGAPRDYIFLVIEKLRVLTGQGLSRGENVPGETANADVFVEVSGILKACAVNLIKLSNDLRYLNAQGEIRLEPVQAGSSIMPGKVNPVIPEAVIQGALQVMANDFLVTEAASRSSLQINEFMPLLAGAFLSSLEILVNISRMMSMHIDFVKADEARCRYYFNRSRMLVTAFVPHFGYARIETILKDFDISGRDDLREFLSEKLGQECVDKTLAPQQLMSLGYRK